MGSKTDAVTPETTPRLSKTGYEVTVEAVAERIFRGLTDDTDTWKLTTLDTIEVRVLLSETETIHEQFPFSILEHGHHQPGPDAWLWIDEAMPKDSLRRQALDIFAGDVCKRLRIKQRVESEEYGVLPRLPISERENETAGDR